jgi:putative aminopeptidase FrvX
MHLLEQLCAIHAPSGDESVMTQFILQYIETHQSRWNVKPTVYAGKGFQDNIIVVLGKPTTSVWAHMDSVGYTVAYDNHLHPIGAPYGASGTQLVGKDSKGVIHAELNIEETEDGRIRTVHFDRTIERGTTLTYAPNFNGEGSYLTSPYLDNRLGCYISLRLMEKVENAVFVFSTWEEHGGGSVPYLAKFIYEKWGVTQALIADITWVTEGVEAGKGVVLSLRDKMLPRKSFTDKIVSLAKSSGIPYQLEVEGAGASDGRELQLGAQPWDWMFIGAPESNAHTPQEKVHKEDIKSMLAMYEYLLNHL